MDFSQFLPFGLGGPAASASAPAPGTPPATPMAVGVLNGAAPPPPNVNQNGQGYSNLFNQAAALAAPKTPAPAMPQIQMPRLPGANAIIDPTRLLAAMRSSIGS
jgi:hypothetical protein